MAESTLEARVSRLEGGYEHLATKADIIGTKADIAALRSEVQLLKWGLGLAILLLGGVLAAVLSG